MAKNTKSKPGHRPAMKPPKPGPAPSKQVAALCYQGEGDNLQILLITSRETGRWVIPKGWPMRKRTDAEAAEREAWEEAGIRGIITEKSLGFYTYTKRLSKGRRTPCMVRIYPLKVEKTLKKYPEKGQRRNKWFSPKKAARKVAEADLAMLIRKFEPAA